MYSSYGGYSAHYASAESYDAFEAQAQYAQSFWSPAGQPAFHDYGYNQDFTQYSQMPAAMNDAGYQHPCCAQSGKQAAMNCGVNLSDYSDFSDSDAESEPQTPQATMIIKKDLSKSLSGGQVAVDDASTANGSDDSDTDTDSCPSPKDDATSTDAASSLLSDAASTANVSDESDVDSDSCPSPKASKRVYARDALMLVRIAVGMCADPPARWSTQPIKARSDGSEWRRGAAEQQQRNGTGMTKLVASATSWLAQQKAVRRDADAETKSDEEVTRSVKSILNKLTVEKFEDLYLKLIACGISKEQHVELLVNEVFEKACLQHHFIDMYADLCMRLEKWLDDSQSDATATGFRKILLNQCQKSFEGALQAPVKLDSEMAEDERLEAAIRHKQRVLGNTRLIGALLNRGMLSPRVLISCANTLLKDPNATDALESLAALLTATGPTFDDNEWSQHGLLCKIFEQVTDLTKNKEVPPRLRFLLRDVLDLRATSWANMKKATAKQAGPMKLEEVHSLAAKEEEEALLAQKKAAGKGSRNNLKSTASERVVSESKQTVSKKENRGPEEWQTVSPKAERKKKAPTTEKARSGNSASNQPRLVSNKGTPSEKAASGSPTNNQPRVVAPPASPSASPKSSPQTTSGTGSFDLRAFRRELTEVMKELGASRDTARARRRFDGVKVPANLQATEFSNLVTRVAEERCSASRRAMFAFVAGLAGNVFDKELCTVGIKAFFDDVYDDLCEEVPRLPEILKSELVPTMRAALPTGTLYKILPPALK